MSEAPKCVICAAPLAKPATGRPPRYCGPECKRLAEFRIRRYGRRLERLEDQASEARVIAASAGFEGEREDGAQRAAAVDGEIRFFESRLRELLSADDTR